jgi:hypothetical protein
MGAASMTSTISACVYTKSGPAKDQRGVDLISDALSFGRLWYADPDAVDNAVDYAKFFSRSHDAVIRVHDTRAMWSGHTSTRTISKSGERYAQSCRCCHVLLQLIGNPELGEEIVTCLRRFVHNS